MIDLSSMKASSVSYIFSGIVPLTRVCRQKCRYCAFRSDEDVLISFDDIQNRIEGLRKGKVVDVVFLAGESPQEYPHIQLYLKKWGCGSWGEYLARACKTAVDMGLFPTLHIGTLDSLETKLVSEIVGSIIIDLVPSSLSNPGEAHENSGRKRPYIGKETIEKAHAAGLPYHLEFLVGIGESSREREDFINDIGRYCVADPYLQDVRIVPFQPTPGTEMRQRPPLPFDDIFRAISLLKEHFPVHSISVAPYLFNRFPELIAAGLNDLGRVPLSTGDPIYPTFPVPGIETLKKRLSEENSVLCERLPITTPAATKRPVVANVLKQAQEKITDRNESSLDLTDNDHCFVCGTKNPNGLQLTFTMRDSTTCSTTWVAGPSHQGYAGIVHGGIIATLLDEVMAHSIISSGIRVVTADIRIRFLRAAPLGFPLTVAGTRGGGRNRIHFARGKVLSAEGIVYAEAEGRFAEC